MFEHWSDNVGSDIYGDRETKCRLCKNSIFDKLNKEDRWKANIMCDKYKRKPMTTMNNDKDFYCKYFEQGLQSSLNLELDDIAKISKKSRVETGKRAKKLGLDKMTMEDINKETRKSRKKK